MPTQLFACSLKLLKRKGVEGISEKKGRRRISQKREKRTMHQKRTGPKTMPAYTHKHGELYTNTQINKCRPTTQRWVFGPPEFSCLPVADSFLPNGVHCSPDLGSGEELSFPQNRLPPSASAGLGLTPAGPPFIGGFLLHQIPSCFPAGPRIYTGLSCSA